GHQWLSAAVAASRNAGVVRTDAGVRTRSGLFDPATLPRRGADPRVRCNTDDRLRPDAAERGYRLPQADPGHDVLLRFHGGGNRPAESTGHAATVRPGDCHPESWKRNSR